MIGHEWAASKTLDFEKWYCRCLYLGKSDSSITLTENEYRTARFAIKNALGLESADESAFDTILVHMPFVLKSIMIDKSLIEKSNLSPYPSYEDVLRSIKFRVLNMSPKAGLLSNIGNASWPQKIKALYNIVLKEFIISTFGIDDE